MGAAARPASAGWVCGHLPGVRTRRHRDPRPCPCGGGNPQTKPAPKFHYTSREPVIGAYITTDGTPRAERDGWSTGPTGTENIWYANGQETDELLISSTKTVRRIIWVLPDGSQRIQQGDLTYYNPETGEYQ